MAKVLISVIVPVYNAAAFLEQCIASVLAQSLREIEVIAVNDGSTDESAAILDRLAGKDQRLRVFHQPNKGVSAARNFGLGEARGQYIGFCDADDWMEPGMLETLYKAIGESQSDWAICNVLVEKEGREPVQRLKISDEVIDVRDAKAGFVRGLLQFRYDNANWNKLYSTKIIREQQLRFAEDMRIWEDLLFNLQYLQFASRAAILSQSFYHYRILSTGLYSGQSIHLVSQLNLLYRHFMVFAEKHCAAATIDAFKVEMARITYMELLPKTAAEVQKKQSGFFAIWRDYTLELQKFIPSLFYYPVVSGSSMERFKKQLLQKGRFRFFALMITLKLYFIKR